MFNLDREPLFSGQPMSFEDLLEEELQLEGLENMHILTVEEVREGLSRVERELATLQSLVDEAHDMTEEIEILLSRLGIRPQNHLRDADPATRYIESPYTSSPREFPRTSRLFPPFMHSIEREIRKDQD